MNKQLSAADLAVLHAGCCLYSLKVGPSAEQRRLSSVSGPLALPRVSARVRPVTEGPQVRESGVMSCGSSRDKGPATLSCSCCWEASTQE